MSNYTPITDFSAKDSLTTGDANKVIKGSEQDAELDAIATAIATKADDDSVVHDTGNETVAGNKTFSGNSTFSGTLTMSAKSAYWAKGADIASADPLVIGTDGNYFDVTGTTTIASYTVAAGMLFMLQFDGALQLTHHATNNNLPGGANITTAAGDRLIGFATAANTVHVLAYFKASGAPIALIKQGDLSTTTATWTLAVTATTSGQKTLTGGTYSWYSLSGSEVNPNWSGLGAGDLGAGILGFFNDGGSTYNVYGNERYIQASPPYTHGPTYVFLGIRPDNTLAHISVAPDPPWAYHGPTDIRPQYYRNGKAYRKVKTINGVPANQARRNPNIVKAIMQETAVVEETEVEVTLSYKDSDMNIIPHAFTGNDLTGITMVMLEPGTKMMQRFCEFCDDGDAREVMKIIQGDYLTIDNNPFNMTNTPPGVVISRARWKLN